MSFYFSIIHVFSYIALEIGVVVLFRTVRRDFWLESLIGATLAVFLIHLYAVFHDELFGFDFRIFRNAGCDVWAGLDPYAPARFAEHPFLNPLTSLPLFAAFAVLPLRISLGVWTILNIAASLALPALGWFALRSQGRVDRSSRQLESLPCGMPLQMVGGLAICLIFSEASLKGFLLGQLSVFTAVLGDSWLAMAWGGWGRTGAGSGPALCHLADPPGDDSARMGDAADRARRRWDHSTRGEAFISVCKCQH